MAVPRKRFSEPPAQDAVHPSKSKAHPKQAPTRQSSQTPCQRPVRAEREVLQPGRSAPGSHLPSRATSRAGDSRAGSPIPTNRSVPEPASQATQARPSLEVQQLAQPVARAMHAGFVCIPQGGKLDDLDDAWEEAVRRIPVYPGWSLLKVSKGVYRMGASNGALVQCFMSNGRMLVTAPTHQGVADAEVFLQWHMNSGSDILRRGPSAPVQRKVSDYQDGVLQSPNLSYRTPASSVISTFGADNRQAASAEHHAREVDALRAENARLNQQLAASLSSIQSPRTSISHMPKEVSIPRIVQPVVQTCPVLIGRVVRSISVAPLPPAPGTSSEQAPPPEPEKPPARRVSTPQPPPEPVRQRSIPPAPPPVAAPREFGPDSWSPRRASRHAALPHSKRDHV